MFYLNFSYFYVSAVKRLWFQVVHGCKVCFHDISVIDAHTDKLQCTDELVIFWDVKMKSQGPTVGRITVAFNCMSVITTMYFTYDFEVCIF